MAKRKKTRVKPHRPLIPAKAGIRVAASSKAGSPHSRGRADNQTGTTGDDQVAASNLTLHELFQQQAMQMLDRADVSEEQRQSILVAMSCPCCGAGGMSFTAKLKPRR
jgi:hypothetical protein